MGRGESDPYRRHDIHLKPTPWRSVDSADSAAILEHASLANAFDAGG
jgi:hypothetical protein